MVIYNLRNTLMSASSRFLTGGLTTLLLAIISTQLYAASSDELYTSVDRSQIYQSETVELTVMGQLELKINFSNLFSIGDMELPTPDIGSLENDFDIIDQQQKYNIQSVNGVNNATITWVYTLSPKRTGELIIPSISHKDKHSKPIAIKVLEGKPSAEKGRPPMLFLEAEVDKQEVYVQEQLVYTLRLYHADNLAGGDLSNPELDNAIVEQVGDQKKYYRMRYNQRYEVIERKFLIFPQKSGELNIAPQTFSGTIIDNRMRKRRRVRDTTDAVQVNVLPPAPNFTGQTWLPAISLNLTEKWDKPLENISVGDSFTRTISIQALGLLGSALPPLSLTENNGFKQYPDQPTTESLEHQAGVESSRTESIAMVAVTAGKVTLPEIRIPWWDTVNQVERVAIIPSRELIIGAANGSQAANLAPKQASPVEQPVMTISEAEKTEQAGSSNTGTPESESSSHRLYLLIIVLLIIGWGITTAWLLKRKVPLNDEVNSNNSNNTTPDEELAFTKLSESIRQQSPSMMGDLVQWAKLKWPNTTINCVADFERLLDDEALTALISRAETYYYSASAANDKNTIQWDNEALLKRLIKIRKKSHTDSKEVLPTFYPKKQN
ncbi:BatD family protein [Alkalimarinus sediminis]|uniref:BatD family protein n=1 Tax=Alkalimarinus sediminis TaxID=1632866 RepID=A0A9E8HU63_9ALTE|nr:BatD family protein [Alkalimarinus sediminis]UZW75794.1 BatD family protein [Alkalimarinus sediminis]